MDKKKLVTIIMPYYNLGAFVDEAVESVLAQTYKHWELLIVNDGSTDELSLKKLEAYKKHADTRITLLETENQGLPATRNFAFTKAQGDYICSLDADDKYKPTFLEKTVSVLDSREDVGIVSTYWELFGREKGVWETTIKTPLEQAIQNKISVASLVRREAWERVGGYATDMSGYQDWDFWIKIIAEGYKVEIIPEALFEYRRRSDSMLTKSIEKDIELYNTIITHNKDFFTSNSLEIIQLARKEWLELNLLHKDLGLKLAQAERKLVESQIESNNRADHVSKLLYERDYLVEELEKIHNSAIWQLRTALFGSNIALKARAKLLLKPFVYRIPGIQSILTKVREPKPVTIRNDKWDGPIVTVIIPLYNYGHYIDECIESVLSQGIENIEIIIVEGFSNDGTREIVRDKSWPHTRIIFQESRKSIGENRLTGISEAKGKYVCTLDADDKLAPRYLKNCIEALEAGYYDVAFTSVRLFDEATGYLTPAPLSSEGMFEGHNQINSASVFRKSFWEKNNVGYSDQRNVFEDYDFWLRMLKAGARFVRLPAVYYDYRVHTSTGNSMTDIRINEQSEMDERTAAPYKNYKNKQWYIQGEKRRNTIYKADAPRINTPWKKEPLISIVTPVFNGEKFIEDSILKLQQQTYTNFEHIIIDGGSKDGTVDILKKHTDKVFFISEKDGGQSDGINKGLKMANGDIVTWLGVDDYYADNDVLKRVAKYFEDPKVDIISGKSKVSFLDSDNEDYIVPQLPVDEELLIRWWWFHAIPPQPSIFHRKSILEDVGYLDLSLDYTMDHELWLRMVSNGYTFTMVDDLLSVYQVHEDSKTGSSAFKFRQEHDKVAKWYWGKPWQLKFWRRMLQYYYARYYKFPKHFAAFDPPKEEK